MRTIFHIAARDFLATVSTKGFIIAVVLPLVAYAIVLVAFPRFTNNQAPAVRGRVTVIDPTGQVHAGVREYLRPEAVAERRAAALNRMTSGPMAGLVSGSGGATAQNIVVGEQPHLAVIERPASALTQEKAHLNGPRGEDQQLSVVVVHANAIVATEPDKYGTYDFFVRANLDRRVQSEIRDAVHDAIVSARVGAAGFDPKRIDVLTTVERTRSITVTETGESEISPGLSGMIPMIFALLLMMSVMSSGQYLLTTTVEEKSSRTMEVILSAVSPWELLTGKILGQMAVGLVILLTYTSVGVLSLVSMAMLGLLDMSLLVYLLIFFLITYLVMGSVMAAVGSAVNELREAQALMTPITLSMMLPWLFWYQISRDPNSTFAIVLSFLPPMNAFAMLLRMTSTAPPPMWQVWLSIGVGMAAAAGALWFASRVFKIGLLMHGRPPNLATLIRWARQG
ncbi:MAG TPA: ABC transporter permease [Vicinamibacterales bacterium]|nr:ABC transporter permease [Vicinamibacterales bacterium]